MIFIKKYWTLIAIVAALLLGMFIAPRNDKDMERQFEKEREQLIKKNAELNRQVKARTVQIKAIEEKMNTDSLENSKRLSASNAEIKRLKTKIGNVNFKNADVRALDSIRAVLYSSDSLPTHFRK